MNQLSSGIHSNTTFDRILLFLDACGLTCAPESCVTKVMRMSKRLNEVENVKTNRYFYAEMQAGPRRVLVPKIIKIGEAVNELFRLAA